MALSENPFVVLSYVGGPAILTNSTALLLMSTSNRFGRAVDRSRHLAAFVAKLTPDRSDAPEAEEIVTVGRRLRLIGRALSGFYLAVAMFSLATLTSIIGAATGEFISGTALDVIIAAAVLFGLIGFAGLVSGAIALVVESRLAEGSLAREQKAALAEMHRALGRR